VPRLAEAGATVATAESLTGGRLAAELTEVPGSSAVYAGGVVSYATNVKTGVLGVPSEVVDAHGVVSAECARAMADGVRRLLATTYALATTGVAGPEEQEGKPVGTVYVGVAGPEGVTATALALAGDRGAIQAATVDAAVSALGVMMGADPTGPSGEDTGLR
jgi:nicotinamide-nucleotide amidase